MAVRLKRSGAPVAACGMSAQERQRNHSERSSALQEGSQTGVGRVRLEECHVGSHYGEAEPGSQPAHPPWEGRFGLCGCRCGHMRVRCAQLRVRALRLTPSLLLLLRVLKQSMWRRVRAVQRKVVLDVPIQTPRSMRAGRVYRVLHTPKIQYVLQQPRYVSRRHPVQLH